MCRDHDAVYHARGHIDFAYHRRLPDVGLVQFRPGPKLGGNDFLTGPESFIVGFFQFVAGSLLRSKIRAARERLFPDSPWMQFLRQSPLQQRSRST